MFHAAAVFAPIFARQTKFYWLHLWVRPAIFAGYGDRFVWLLSCLATLVIFLRLVVGVC